MATVDAALVSAYPTEDDAREAWPADHTLGAYRGIRICPTPEQPQVHVFSDATDEQLTEAGWVRAERVEHDASTFGDMARGVRVYLRNDGSRREEPWEGA